MRKEWRIKPCVKVAIDKEDYIFSFLPNVTDKNRKDICWRCDLQDAKDEFWRVFEEETWLGRMLVKFLNWLENILSRRR
jgi:hypothetical protein